MNKQLCKKEVYIHDIKDKHCTCMHSASPHTHTHTHNQSMTLQNIHIQKYK
jgi:hypothetical protein